MPLRVLVPADASSQDANAFRREYCRYQGFHRPSVASESEKYDGDMAESRDEVRDFLASRRARVTPEQAGIVSHGVRKRRVSGLRREEVAMLAGVSVDYYVRLERGTLTGVSDQVLDAVARALQLDPTEQTHLRDLIRSDQNAKTRVAPSHVRPALQQMLDAMTTPAWIRNGRSDFLAANLLGRALYSPMFDTAVGTPNTARFVFLDERAQDFYGNWGETAADMVAVLRAEAGRRPYDKKLTDLIGELVTRSDCFRDRWASHDVHEFRGGTKTLHHPVVGALDLAWESVRFTADEGLTMSIYSAEAGSDTAHALQLLGNWASVPHASQN